VVGPAEVEEVREDADSAREARAVAMEMKEDAEAVVATQVKGVREDAAAKMKKEAILEALATADPVAAKTPAKSSGRKRNVLDRLLNLKMKSTPTNAA